MKLGIQTIILGEEISDLKTTLEVFRDAGFQGVEVFQPLSRIYLNTPQGKRAVTIQEMVTLLKEYELTFLGMAGGSFSDRVETCKVLPMEDRPLYLYSEDLVADGELAKQEGFKLAFHPHAFKKLSRIEEARDLLNAPHLYWMPDTAHMFVMREDPAQILKELPTNKLIAVHLKDWDAAYGRSYHRYAKGFVALGQGDVPLAQIIEVLKSRNYDGWLVVEQDYALGTPTTCLNESIVWLQTYFPQLKAIPQNIFPKPSEPVAQSLDFLAGTQCAGMIEIKPCYQSIANLLRERFAAIHVALWSYSPERDDMCLLAASPKEEQTSAEEEILDKGEALIGQNVDSLTIEEYPIAPFEPSQKVNLQWSRIAQKHEAKWVGSIPVPNLYNPNSVRFVVGIMQKEPQKERYLQEMPEILRGIAQWADSSMDAVCAYVAGKVNFYADKAANLDSFLKDVEGLIQKTLECQGLTIFLTNRTSERLEERSSTGIQWDDTLPDSGHFYRLTNGLDSGHPTVQAWVNRRPVFRPKAPERNGRVNQSPKSQEVVPKGDEAQDNVLIVPLTSINLTKEGAWNTDVIGVIRCRNKKPHGLANGERISPYFTEDDASILTAICDAAVPHIEMLLRDEWLVQGLGRLGHELNSPVNSLRAAVDELREELLSKGMSKDSYIAGLSEDILSWTQLMTIVTGSVRELKGERMVFQFEKTLLMGEVIAPIKPQIQYLLNRRKFSVNSIYYSEFREIPALFVDRNRFQQVFFNILSNAIKYALPSPKDFKVEILTSITSPWYRIICRDYGLGIDEEYVSLVFEEGVRGTDYQNRLVEGLGIGLWIVRRIVEGHGGKVEVLRAKNPTEIAIYLPIGLKDGPPKQQKG